jgi:hypothetical protein
MIGANSSLIDSFTVAVRIFCRYVNWDTTRDTVCACQHQRTRKCCSAEPKRSYFDHLGSSDGSQPGPSCRIRNSRSGQESLEVPTLKTRADTCRLRAFGGSHNSSAGAFCGEPLHFIGVPTGRASVACIHREPVRVLSPSANVCPRVSMQFGTSVVWEISAFPTRRRIQYNPRWQRLLSAALATRLTNASQPDLCEHATAAV